MTTVTKRPAASDRASWLGLTYAAAAAGLAAVFLFLPILLVGFTIQVVASVAAGEIVAWRSSIELTYFMLAPFVIVSVLLLLIPIRLWHAAGRIIGRSRATLWVGGLLAAALAVVALVWFVQAQLRSAHASQPEYWYALAFATAAVVVLLVSVLVVRRAVTAAVAVVGVAAAAVLGLSLTLVAVWGSAPRIPSDAQTVDIVSTRSGIELHPDTVRAGTVYFVAEGAEHAAAEGEVSFVSAGYGSEVDDVAIPASLTEDGISALRLGDYHGTSIESGLMAVSRATLREGYYAFVIADAEGLQPGVAPRSVTVLEVLP